MNVLQSVQLPFALVPLIKFVGSDLIMKEFAISPCSFWFATLFGVALFALNFYTVFAGNSYEWWQILLIIIASLLYFALIYMVIREEVKPLRELT